MALSEIFSINLRKSDVTAVTGGYGDQGHVSDRLTRL